MLFSQLNEMCIRNEVVKILQGKRLHNHNLYLFSKHSTHETSIERDSKRTKIWIHCQLTAYSRPSQGKSARKLNSRSVRLDGDCSRYRPKHRSPLFFTVINVNHSDNKYATT